jgi:hypothetical protein
MPEEITPAVQFARDLAEAQSQLSTLQQKSHLSSARDSLEDLDTKIGTLSARIIELRSRKYAFDKDLAEQATQIAERWKTLQPSIVDFIERQEAQMQIAIRPLESQISYVAIQTGNPENGLVMLKSFNADMETLESKISGAESTADGMYDELQGQFTTLNSHLAEITWMLDRMDEASFPFLEAESGIKAVKATWARNGREDGDSPQGTLFITDCRLVFEQNQEIATKKVLFVVTERKKVQQKLMEVPVELIEDIKATKQGVFKNQDFIELRLGHGAPFPSATFHIFGQDCNSWQVVLKKAAAHEFDDDRAVAVDPVEVAKVKAAPTKCPSCGAVIQQAIPHNASQMNCEYCGSVIRL